jgi:hypothetical protein
MSEMTFIVYNIVVGILCITIIIINYSYYYESNINRNRLNNIIKNYKKLLEKNKDLSYLSTKMKEDLEIYGGCSVCKHNKGTWTTECEYGGCNDGVKSNLWEYNTERKL